VIEPRTMKPTILEERELTIQVLNTPFAINVEFSQSPTTRQDTRGGQGISDQEREEWRLTDGVGVAIHEHRSPFDQNPIR
jgi:hypothetical protein